MDIDFKILIDASGSMGYMKGELSDSENKYLLPDGSTRTDLTKKILISNILPSLSFTSNISIFSFRGEIQYNGSIKKVVNNKLVTLPKLDPIYSGAYDLEQIIKHINNLKNPKPASTPLYFSLANTILKSESKKINILVFSDGDANDRSNFDSDILTLISEKKKDCIINIIGIDQNTIAAKKSKNLATKTGGIYVNLKAINYKISKLDILLSQLKTQLVANVLKESIESTKSIPVISPSETENSNSTPDIVNQVKQNTQSLGHISLQLDNILKLLHSKNVDESKDELEVIENTIYNQRIGRDSERYLFNELKKLFKNNSSIKVLWLNEIEEKGFPYDILVQDDNKEFYYECKGTSSNLNEFQLTKNEWNFYLNNIGRYRLCFVSNIDSTPSYIRLMDLLDDMKNKTIVPCATQNKNFKANRIVFQINK
ncbi:DUF3883 domain-containing protein [uncultured Polaribacter sp.]|uniref:protein NO VEIN domain-containing protein n=1 Tax=uncultured Polaribacter sp. TaxID=174711 RepID=UPI00259B0D47|nr:DUF3883 domain-containing protein [uncultured Polaribacter sp.]